MNTNAYFPILKTTISEIRAAKKSNFPSHKSIIPIFELTKARKSKKDEIGDVYKRVSEIKSIIQDRAFILDLTSEESLSNPQIESFFDDANNFENWRDFIAELGSESLNVCPVIQAYDDSTIEDIDAQMRFFSEILGSFAIRVKPSFINLDITEKLLETAQKYDLFRLILDFEYVGEDNFSLSTYSAQAFIDKSIEKKIRLGEIILCSSSFPKQVNHKNASEGSFDTFEMQFYRAIAEKHPKLLIQYGDYASVHPVRNEATAYNWVPRIDFPLEDRVVYFRKSRNAGGYQDCAERLSKHPDYLENIMPCWGIDEINQAVTKPNGRSPSYWISVRINLHIERTLRSLKG